MVDRFDPLFTRILIASKACISTIVIGESECAIVDWCIRSRDTSWSFLRLWEFKFSRTVRSV